MQRRKLSREYKLEAVKLVKERGGWLRLERHWPSGNKMVPVGTLYWRIEFYLEHTRLRKGCMAFNFVHQSVVRDAARTEI